jgi:serine/threonine protein kinase/tetratricopeptide (TPR) repeat protein
VVPGARLFFPFDQKYTILPLTTLETLKVQRQEPANRAQPGSVIILTALSVEGPAFFSARPEEGRKSVPDRVGQPLGNYRLTRLLGQGGQALVYLGKHVHLETPAAIKVLPHQMHSADRERFRSEARLIARLKHPQIVRVLEFGVEDQTPYLVMEYAPGGCLRKRHPKGSQLPLSLVVSYVKQIAQALQYAHREHQLIHRDIKPANLLLGQDNELLLSDFGIALVLSTQEPQVAQQAVGTFPYMAPEQWGGKPCAASDQYALAIMVYEWLAGACPFQGSPLELLRQHALVPPPPLCVQVPTLSSAAEAILFKALAKEPEQRFPSVQAFALALSALAEGEEALATQPAATLFPFPKQDRALSGSQPQIWNVPLARNPFFTGRERLLAQLHSGLHTFRLAHALSGLGGVGKTQVALEYAYRYGTGYQAVLWARAETREELHASFTEIAGLLDLPQKEDEAQEVIIQAVKDWLSRESNWLLILDNADELALLSAFLPTRFSGQVLLTTRAQATGKLARRWEVETMDENVGALLLLRRAGLIAPDASFDAAELSDQAQAKAVTKELGGLPLALDQAGAYLEETGCGLAGYHRLYQTRQSELLADRRGNNEDHPEPVATTWALSFERVEQRNPAAADLLRFCAFVAPDAIPEELLTEGAASLGERLASVVSDPLLLNQALLDLRASSLLSRNPQEGTLSLHRLLQAVIRDALPVQLQQAWKQRAIRAVNAAFPDDLSFAVWLTCERLLPHALRCATWIEQLPDAEPAFAHVLNQVGEYLYYRGRYSEAEPLYQRALCIREQKLGDDHPETATSLNNLAELYRTQSQYALAEPLYVRALSIDLSVYGPDHPDVGSDLNNLALLYQAQGKYAQAEPLFQRALSISERHLGAEHPLTANSLNNLALLYDTQGNYANAEPLYQRALCICEQQLGETHPLTATTLNNLAVLLVAQEKLSEAEPLYQRVLALDTQAYGAEHPDVALDLNNLANLYGKQGRIVEAESLYQRALQIWEHSLGSEHPLVAHALHGLARLSQAQGRWAEAESWYQRTLHLLEHSLGSQHPDVAHPLDGWASLYQEQGQFAQAEGMYQRALTLREQSLGREHPRTRQTRRNYASLLRATGRVSEAEALESEADGFP